MRLIFRDLNGSQKDRVNYQVPCSAKASVKSRGTWSELITLQVALG